MEKLKAALVENGVDDAWQNLVVPRSALENICGRVDALQELMVVAILMAQELQEFVDDAIEAGGGENALPATQELLRDWEAAYKKATT